MLLHFDEKQRIEVLQMFHQALQPGGILVMEHTQKLPETLAARFRQVAPYAQVFRKVEEPQSQDNTSHRHPERPVDIHDHRPFPTVTSRIAPEPNTGACDVSVPTFHFPPQLNQGE